MKDSDSMQGCPGLANTTLLFCITSPEGNFCDLNPGWVTVTGFTTEELLGKNYLDWAHPDDIATSKKLTETLLNGGEAINFVNRLRCKNGEYKWLQWVATTNNNHSLIFLAGQKGTLFNEVEEEINHKTELLQERLKEMQCLNAVITILSNVDQPIDTSVDAVITINLEGTILSWNEGAEKLFGIAAKDSIGMNICKLYQKSHLDELEYIYSEVKAGRKIENFSTRRIRPDGKLLNLQINISPLSNSSGKIENYLTIAHDVTRMIDQQNILRESKDYLQKTQEIAKIGTFEIDLEQGTVCWSNELFKLFEKSPENYHPDLDSFFAMVHPDDRETIKTAFLEYQKDEAMHETIHRLQLDSGETRVHRMFARTIFTESGKPRSMSCIVQDITDIYSERQKRIQSETQFRMMAENVHDVIWTLDIDGKFLYVSPSVERLRGFTPEEVMKQTFQETLCPSSLPIAFENIQLSVKQLQAGIKITTKTFLLEQPCKNGSTVWTEATISGTYDETGNFLYFLGVSRDIAARKEIEDQLRIKEAAIRSSISAIALLNSDGTIIYVNDALIRDGGYSSAEEVIGQNITSFAVFPDRLASIYEAVLNGIPVNRETQVRRKDGSIMDVQLTATPVYSGEEILNIMLSFVDITERNRSFRELTASNARFAALIKSGVVGLWYHNIKTGESSEAIQWLSMLGYEKGDMPDHISTWETLCHPDDRKRASEHLNQFIRQEIPDYKSEFRLRHKQGHYVWIESKGKVIEFDDAQKPLIIMGIHLDITERKEREITAQYNNNRIAAQYRISQLEGRSEEDIIELSVNEAIKLTKSHCGSFHFIDETGNFLKSVWWSPDARGNYHKNIEPENPYWESTILHQCLTSGKPVCSGVSAVSENIITPPANTSKAHHYLIHPVSFDNTIRYIIGVGNKVINYDPIDEEQLRLFMEEVVKIIHKSNLVRELEITKKKAEEASQLKSSLLLNMSHELRTPLNGILGFAGLLKETVTDESMVEMVNFIHQSGKRLMVTLTSIMELAQLESSHKTMTIKEMNMSELLKDVVGKFEDRITAKNLHLTRIIRNDLMAVSDPDLVANIYFYIIDNAIKFTPAGQIWIILEKINRKGEDWVVFSVKDTGIGITEKQMKILFEPFRQGSEGIGRSHEGNGLGLTLCKKFLDMLEGEIEIESKPQFGSTFSLYFHTHPAGLMAKTGPILPEKPVPAPVVKKQVRERPLILVVEDNEANLELLLIYLEERFVIEKAMTGEMAVKLATLNDYDLILMDINLGPEMDGIEATREIRKMSKNTHIPVIAVTGYATDQEKQAILEQGLNAHIVKPFTRQEILTLIDRVLTP